MQRSMWGTLKSEGRKYSPQNFLLQCHQSYDINSAPVYTVQHSAPVYTVQHSAPVYTVQHSAPVYTVQHSAPVYSWQASCKETLQLMGGAYVRKCL